MSKLTRKQSPIGLTSSWFAFVHILFTSSLDLLAPYSYTKMYHNYLHATPKKCFTTNLWNSKLIDLLSPPWELCCHLSLFLSHFIYRRFGGFYPYLDVFIVLLLFCDYISSLLSKLTMVSTFLHFFVRWWRVYGPRLWSWHYHVGQV